MAEVCTECGSHIDLLLFPRKKKRLYDGTPSTGIVGKNSGLCYPCLKSRNAKQQKDIRGHRLRQKKCQRCGTDLPLDRAFRVTLCSSCSKNLTQNNNILADARIQKGLCRGCGGAPVEGKRQCRRCLDKCCAYQKARARARIDQGLCVLCGTAPVVGTSNLCYQHYFKSSAGRTLGSRCRWQELEALWRASGYVCYLCLDTLTLGINNELDHMLPISRFPDLADDISNLRWACVPCNQSKQNMTPDEYHTHCQRVASNPQVKEESLVPA